MNKKYLKGHLNVLDVCVLIMFEVHGLDVEGRHDDLLVGQGGLRLLRKLQTEN